MARKYIAYYSYNETREQREFDAETDSDAKKYAAANMPSTGGYWKSGGFSAPDGRYVRNGYIKKTRDGSYCSRPILFLESI